MGHPFTQADDRPTANGAVAARLVVGTHKETLNLLYPDFLIQRTTT